MRWYMMAILLFSACFFIHPIQHLEKKQNNLSPLSEIIRKMVQKYMLYLIDIMITAQREEQWRKEETLATHILSLLINIPQNYTSFLESNENKTSLASYMQENIQPTVDKNEKIYVSGSNGDNTIKITRVSVTSDPELKSNMEEVDGRIIFHAITTAYSGAKTITVRSRDTNVAVLLILHFQQIGCEQLFIYCGRNEKVWYVPIHAIYSALSSLK